MVPMQMSVTTMPLLPSRFRFMRWHGRKGRNHRKNKLQGFNAKERSGKSRQA
jgi:hypothetical protein